MSNTISSLREDHRNIAKLLNALEHEIELVAAAADPDWDVLRATANYFCDYADRYHHPKEDAVYRQLASKFPDQAPSIGDVMAEHRAVHTRALQFRDNVQSMFLDAIMPRDRLVNAGRRFVEAELLHMQKEDELFFPIAEKLLTKDDWIDIETRLKTGIDPLFGDSIEEQYRAIRERLDISESENRS